MSDLRSPGYDARRAAQARRRSRAFNALLVGLVLVVIAAIAIPNLIQARRQNDQVSPIGALKTLNTSQTLYREGDKDRNGTLDYGTLAQLSDTTLIDAVLGSGTKQGYHFACAPSALTPEFLWFAVANPVTPGVTGDRYFCTNHAGVIYYTGLRGGSIAMNTTDCEIPASCLPVGK